mgnify:CR=1 FL=1
MNGELYSIGSVGSTTVLLKDIIISRLIHGGNIIGRASDESIVSEKRVRASGISGDLNCSN